MRHYRIEGDDATVRYWTDIRIFFRRDDGWYGQGQVWWRLRVRMYGIATAVSGSCPLSLESPVPAIGRGSNGDA